MKNSVENSTPVPKSPETLMDLLDAEAERLQFLSGAIAGVAIHDALQQQTLIASTDRIGELAAVLRHEAGKLEVVEAFGGEESYWTVYRMFTAPDNIGRLWTMDEIWAHLAKNYDLSGETPESLAATLDEWASDIEADAADKQVNGLFSNYEDGYVFAMKAGSRKVSTPFATTQEAPVSKAPVAIVNQENTVEDEPAPHGIAEHISLILQNSPDRVAKQADVKKLLTLASESFDVNHLQDDIDSLVANGNLYKFRRLKVAYLSLTPRDDELETPEEARERAAEKIFDADMALSILGALVAPGRHFTQKYTLNELWRTINDISGKSQAVSEAEIARLKNSTRQLQSMHLVSAGGEKMGTGGVRTKTATSTKRHRSATRHAYKVGLLSQDVKKEVQGLLGDARARDYLQELFTSTTEPSRS